MQSNSPTVAAGRVAGPRRRGFLAAVLACAAVVAGLASAGAPAAAPPAAPNVVVVQTDDQTLADLYATYRTPSGARARVMANTIKRIAHSGVTFGRYYASVPVCCPSRAALLTGRYAHNNRVRTNDPPGGYGAFIAHNREHNLAVWLQRANYRTIHLGKFMNGYATENAAEMPPGWDEWRTLIGEARLFYGYRLNENGVPTLPYGDPEYGTRDPAGCPEPQPGGACNYLTDVTTGHAVEAVDRFSRGPRPFYLQVDYIAPHGDIHPPAGPEPAPRHQGLIPRARAPRVPSFNERDVSDKPGFVRRSGRLSPFRIHQIDVRRANRLESLRAVDEGVGRILDALAAAGELERTYVFFVSDNGFFQGEHRFDLAKFLPYEPANHVPLLVRGPGVPQGQRSAELVANVDIAPTILAIAGAEPTVRIDGRSLLAFAQDPRRRSRRPILLQGFAAGSGEPVTGSDAGASIAATPRDYAGMRFGRYKYVQYRSGARELYDLRTDPHELNSLQADPRYRRIRTLLARRLARLRTCAGAPCRRQLKPLPPPLSTRPAR